MTNKFNLSNRLLLCAKMAGDCNTVADIGTDHAYIPIWLALNAKTKTAIACDIRTGPLENASKNIKKYGLENMIKTRLSDGLNNLGENEADTIIIAGMGGNIISKILDECTWKSKNTKTFILQPMKYEERLREYLADNGYEILEEQSTLCSGKVYTCIKVVYHGKNYPIKEYQKYIGKLDENYSSESSQAYIKKQIKNLENHLRGAQAKNIISMEKYYSQIIKDLQNFII